MNFINHVTSWLLIKTHVQKKCIFISRLLLQHPVSFRVRTNNSQTLWMPLPLSAHGESPTTSSKAFVQLQKVHRIIHPVFRTVQHSLGNTSPESNHFLRQSYFGLLENGSHNRKQQSGKNGVHTERQFFLQFFLHFFLLRLRGRTALFLNVRSHDDVFVNAQNKNNLKIQNHSPFIQKSARFSLDDKKSANHGSLPVFWA